MSSLYRYLGAHTGSLPYLWLAAPISGLLIQPLIGYLSDCSCTRFGKRIPYILMWGILASVTIGSMPFSSTLCMAAILLWILDCSINGCTESLRALTADLTSTKQKPTAFAVQTIFAGLGASIAALLPWFFHNIFLIKSMSACHIPCSIIAAFITGALILILTVFWTTSIVRENTVPNIILHRNKNSKSLQNAYKTLKNIFKGLFVNLIHMPLVIKKFYTIQFFTWTGMFCFWLYFGLSISQHLYHLPPNADVMTNSIYGKILAHGTEWTGIAFSCYQITSILYAIMLPVLARKTSPRFIHGVSLLIGAASIIAIPCINSSYLLLVNMIGVGMMWGSIMTMPYAIISAEIPPKKMGVYLGMFNITITIPQIISGIILGYITGHIFHNYAMYTVELGGILIFIGGALMLWKNNDFNFKQYLKIFLDKKSDNAAGISDVVMPME